MSTNTNYLGPFRNRFPLNLYRKLPLVNYLSIKKVPREQRICKACKVFDDEKHFLLHCHINYNIRNSLIQEIENYYPDFNQLDSIVKLKIILNPSQDILSNVVDYIKQSMELPK
jgi:hypothetical protein